MVSHGHVGHGWTAGLESHVAAAPAEALQTDAGCHRAMALVKL